MASADQELDVCVHEGDGHRDRRSIRKDEPRVTTEFLDDAKDVIPATTVQA